MSIEPPLFQAPTDPAPPDIRPDRPRTARRFGKGYEYTESERAARFARLDAIGRRCDARGRTCIHNAATRELDLFPLDDQGVRTGDMVTVLSCSRHRSEWARSTVFEVVVERQLPPQEPRRHVHLPTAVLLTAYRRAVSLSSPDQASYHAEALQRGIILRARDTAVGGKVRAGAGRRGTVSECHPDGAITVDWGKELEPDVPTSRYTLFTLDTLETGALRARR